MSFSRKGSFELDKFYQNLNRIQRSLGKSAPRTTTSSLSKHNNAQKEEDRAHNISQFKKQLHNKGLIKGKIKLDRPYDKQKMSQATEYEELINTSDNPMLSEQLRESTQDHYERVKNKLECWKRKQRQTDNPYKLREEITQNSRISNKQNIQISFDDKNQKGIDADPRYEQTSTDKMIEELNKRNDIFKVVEANVRGDGRKIADLSIKLQDHFRMHATMAKIISQFKKMCKIDTEDLKEVYQILKPRQKDSSQGDNRTQLKKQRMFY